MKSITIKVTNNGEEKKYTFNADTVKDLKKQITDAGITVGKELEKALNYIESGAPLTSLGAFNTFKDIFNMGADKFNQLTDTINKSDITKDALDSIKDVGNKAINTYNSFEEAVTAINKEKEAQKVINEEKEKIEEEPRKEKTIGEAVGENIDSVINNINELYDTAVKKGEEEIDSIVSTISFYRSKASEALIAYNKSAKLGDVSAVNTKKIEDYIVTMIHGVKESSKKLLCSCNDSNGLPLKHYLHKMYDVDGIVNAIKYFESLAKSFNISWDDDKEKLNKDVEKKGEEK